MIAVAQPLIRSASEAEAIKSQNKKDEQQRYSSVDIILEPVQTQLAAHIMRCWQAAKIFKDPTNTALLNNAKQRKGEYTSGKLDDIRDFGGSEIFIKLTMEKCRVAESWIEGIMQATEDVPFLIKPTPVPDLPQHIQEEIITEVQSEIMNAEATLTLDDVRELGKSIENKKRRELKEEASDRCRRMQEKINDI